MRLNGNRLRLLREVHLMMTQEAFAAAVGLTESTVNRLERGKQVARVSTVQKIARACDVNGAWLYGAGPDTPIPPSPFSTHDGVVDHLDGDPTNTDPRNLRIVTPPNPPTPPTEETP